MKALKDGQCARLVIAATRVNQDDMIVFADHPRVHARHDLAAFGMPEPWGRQEFGLLKNTVIKIRKKKLRKETGRQHFLNTCHVMRANLKCAHLRTFFQFK